MEEQKKEVRAPKKRVTVKELEEQIQKLNVECGALRVTNTMLEGKNSELNNKIADLEELCDSRGTEIYRLKHRGLWARIFNK